MRAILLPIHLNRPPPWIGFANALTHKMNYLELMIVYNNIMIVERTPLFNKDVVSHIYKSRAYLTEHNDRPKSSHF